MELLALLTLYYNCTALATDGLLTQAERFACNETYQQVKRVFAEEDLSTRLTAEQNIRAYRSFKVWEQENAALVQVLKATKP